LALPFQRFATHKERVDDRAGSLHPHLTDMRRAQLIDRSTPRRRRGLADSDRRFDYTFSVPKSVSVLWGSPTPAPRR
jgi:hypothetical protein